MSLINRMLGDLAARQAPGSEAISGVRLNDPLEQAGRSLSKRTWLILLCIAVLVAIVVWKLLTASPEPPAPQLRMADDLSDHQTPGGMSTHLGVEADQKVADAAEIAKLTPIKAVPPTLKFEGAIKIPDNLSIGTLRASEQPRSKPLPGEVETPRHAKPRAPSKPAQKNSVTASEAPTQDVTAASKPAPRPKKVVEKAPPTPTGPSLSDRKAQARGLLAAGNAGGALDVLTPAALEDDLELAALRAAAFQRLQRHEEAAREYGMLTVADAARPSHWVGLGISLENLGQTERAHLAYQKALSSSTLSPALRSFASERILSLQTP